jgi:hypothetical protein
MLLELVIESLKLRFGRRTDDQALEGNLCSARGRLTDYFIGRAEVLPGTRTS